MATASNRGANKPADARGQSAPAPGAGVPGGPLGKGGNRTPSGLTGNWQAGKRVFPRDPQNLWINGGGQG